MTAVSTRRPARVSIIVGIILLASAIVVAFNATSSKVASLTASVPPQFHTWSQDSLACLGISHFIAAFRSETAEVGPADWTLSC